MILGPWLLALAVLLLLSVVVVVLVEKRRDRKLAADFNERLDRVLHGG